MQYCRCCLQRMPLPLNQCSLRIRFTECCVLFSLFISLTHSFTVSILYSLQFLALSLLHVHRVRERESDTPLRLKFEIAMWKSCSWRWSTTFIYKPVINIVSALKNRNCGIMYIFGKPPCWQSAYMCYSVCIIEPCINNNITHKIQTPYQWPKYCKDVQRRPWIMASE